MRMAAPSAPKRSMFNPWANKRSQAFFTAKCDGLCQLHARRRTSQMDCNFFTEKHIKSKSKNHHNHHPLVTLFSILYLNVLKHIYRACPQLFQNFVYIEIFPYTFFVLRLFLDIKHLHLNSLNVDIKLPIFCQGL